MGGKKTKSLAAPAKIATTKAILFEEKKPKSLIQQGF